MRSHLYQKISIASDNASDIILHKLEWSHGTRLVSGLRRRFPASVSPCGGGYTYGYT